MTREGDFELVTLRGGARAVRHVGHGEVMHPAGGPWREANELYVKQSKLAEQLCEEGRAPLCLYDVGLGAGTNLIAALTCARQLGERRRRELIVYSYEIDLAPLRLAIADKDGFPFLEGFASELRELIERGEFTREGLCVKLLLGDAVNNYEQAAPADLIFFDPFSPKANPAMWTPEAFARLHARANAQATLFTYSAATPTRVSLLLGGFYVGAGDATGEKGETTAAATWKEGLVNPLGERWLERWRRSSARMPHGASGEGSPSMEQVENAILDHPQFKGSIS